MKRNFARLAFLAALVCGLLTSGCLVVSSHHLSKPAGPSETVEFHHPPQGDLWGWYIRHDHSTNADLDISVANSTERFQVGFLFWVIPIPYSKSGSPDADLELTIRPTQSEVVFDPWRIEYIPTNGLAVEPFKVLRLDNGTWKPVSRGQLFINKSESFSLKYQAPCNPDLPFRLSIGGIATPSQTNSIIHIEYQRSKIVRADFRLPY